MFACMTGGEHGVGEHCVDVDKFWLCIRGTYPGLDIPHRVIPDDDLKGLWKLLDTDRNQDVSDKEFMRFMKREGAALSLCMHANASPVARKKARAATMDEE